jgi:septal ring factor EnvC (AmiA/AmiB activator)
MSLKNLFFVTFIVFLVHTGDLNAQQTDQKKLEAKRKALKEEINKIKTYIDKTQKKETNLSTQVQDLNQKITTRQQLINTIDSEVEEMNRIINQKTREINLVEKDLNVVKKDYADMVYKSYKNRNADNQLLFLLSSQSVQQGYLRFQYLKQYSQYRKKQAEVIQKKSKKLQTLIDSLKVKKDLKESMLDDKKTEQAQMETEKLKQVELVKKYQKQKKEYVAQVKKKQEEEKLLNDQIENLIKEAIKKSTQTKTNTTKSTTKTTTTTTKKETTPAKTQKNEFTLAPEAKALAGQFSANKGKLPWPVEKGLVTVRFGKQPDPMDAKLTIESSGVRIATAENQKARAVFEGKVMAIQKNPQNGILSVLIQHGNYITVYANLRSVSVAKGDQVKIKQNIGTIQTDNVTGKTILKFQIWQDDQKLDPSGWIDGM